jgi:hypothetical protein
MVRIRHVEPAVTQRGDAHGFGDILPGWQPEPLPANQIPLGRMPGRHRVDGTLRGSSLRAVDLAVAGAPGVVVTGGLKCGCCRAAWCGITVV